MSFWRILVVSWLDWRCWSLGGHRISRLACVCEHCGVTETALEDDDTPAQKLPAWARV